MIICFAGAKITPKAHAQQTSKRAGCSNRQSNSTPPMPSPYAALGSTRLNAAVNGWTEFRDEALRDAETMAQKAVELDADNAEAHRLLGRIYFNKGQFDLANAEYDRAIALNPNDAESYDARGEILLYTGHPKEALESFDVAKRLNPSGGDRLAPVGWAYYFLRRYEDAVTAFALDVRAYPDDHYGYSGLAAAHAQLGRRNEAAQAADDLKRVWPFFEIKRFVEQFQGDDYRALLVEGLRKAGLRWGSFRAGCCASGGRRQRAARVDQMMPTAILQL